MGRFSIFVIMLLAILPIVHSVPDEDFKALKDEVKKLREIVYTFKVTVWGINPLVLNYGTKIVGQMSKITYHPSYETLLYKFIYGKCLNVTAKCSIGQISIPAGWSSGSSGIIWRCFETKGIWSGSNSKWKLQPHCHGWDQTANMNSGSSLDWTEIHLTKTNNKSPFTSNVFICILLWSLPTRSWTVNVKCEHHHLLP